MAVRVIKGVAGVATIDRQSLEFVYSSRVQTSSEWRLLDLWGVDAWHTVYKGATEKVEHVGSASFAVVDFDRLNLAQENPAAYVDQYSQELLFAVEVVFDSRGPRDRTLKLTRGEWPVAMLFMEQVDVVRRYRGQQLGHLIAADAIATLGRGCRFVLTYPAPTEKAAAGTEQHKAQRKVLRRYWSGIGFRAFVHGYWVLDLYGRNCKLDRHLLRWDALPLEDSYGIWGAPDG